MSKNNGVYGTFVIICSMHSTSNISNTSFSQIAAQTKENHRSLLRQTLPNLVANFRNHSRKPKIKNKKFKHNNKKCGNCV